MPRTLNDIELETERSIEVVNWTNEDGSWFVSQVVQAVSQGRESGDMVMKDLFVAKV